MNSVEEKLDIIIDNQTNVKIAFEAHEKKEWDLFKLIDARVESNENELKTMQAYYTAHRSEHRYIYLGFIFIV